MVDICAEAGWLTTALNVMHMVQALMQVTGGAAHLPISPCSPDTSCAVMHHLTHPAVRLSLAAY